MPLNGFDGVRLLVAGDVMLDRYWDGRTERISPEAPVPVVRVERMEARAGGAANVAMNIAALGAQAELVGVVGEDSEAAVLDQLLQARSVHPHWVRSSSGTICKLRVLSRHQQLIRMDFEQPAPLSAARALTETVASRLSEAQVLVLSDYAKGALADVETLIGAARDAGVPVLVDPKGDDFSRYAGATLVKPNQSEFERIVGPCPDEAALVDRGRRLMETLSLEALLITRSEHGMLLLVRDESPLSLKAQAQEVFDVTGAGDTVMAVLATARAAGAEWREAARLANEAASLVVRKVGTSVVTREELQRHLLGQRSPAGVLDEPGLIERVRAAQARGERVVMTNGCFDLLHPGHVRYLQAAAALGDRLVVAVNSDASVRRLKGAARPIMPLAARMEMLAALGCVDWVVPFEEETPARLICAVQPDVLVKGGDYRPEEIAGGDCVRARGGEVRTLAFWDGFSTTNIVTRIREGVGA